MSAPGPAPGDADEVRGFADGLFLHYNTFRTDLGNQEDVFVEVTLVNGEKFYCKGFRLNRVENVPGCVMIRGEPPGEEETLVVREDHVLMAKFDTKPEPVRTLGFPGSQ